MHKDKELLIRLGLTKGEDRQLFKERYGYLYRRKVVNLSLLFGLVKAFKKEQ